MGHKMLKKITPKLSYVNIVYYREMPIGVAYCRLPKTRYKYDKLSVWKV